MPTEVVMPRLGWDMQVGSVAEWLKRDGDPVAVGEPICMITGDKATTELEALESGILRISPQAPEPGVDVPVGTLLGYLLAPGEDLPLAAPAAPDALASPASGPTSADARPPSGPTSAGDAVDTGGADGRERRVVATPRARRAATRVGIDWHTLVGSGRGGRILERDVAHASAAAAPPAAPAAQDVMPAAGPRAAAPLPLTGIRRLTAERMAASARTVAAVTLTTEVDATELVRLRDQAAAERQTRDGPIPTYTDLLVKVVACALEEHPALNAELTTTGIVQHADINIGIAVDTAEGLRAPVVHHAAKLSVEAIVRETGRLVTEARAGRSRPEDLTGATFTITNLGMYDIDAFTPIVNVPQCAILGVGRIIARPVVVDESTEQVAVRRMLTLSLTFDHRLVDGAPAARFLQRIKHLVERPTLWLFR